LSEKCDGNTGFESRASCLDYLCCLMRNFSVCGIYGYKRINVTSYIIMDYKKFVVSPYERLRLANKKWWKKNYGYKRINVSSYVAIGYEKKMLYRIGPIGVKCKTANSFVIHAMDYNFPNFLKKNIYMALAAIIDALSFFYRRLDPKPIFTFDRML